MWKWTTIREKDDLREEQRLGLEIGPGPRGSREVENKDGSFSEGSLTGFQMQYK